MEEDSRYKLLKDLSESKYHSELLSKKSYSKEDINELVSEGLIYSVGESATKSPFPFYRITLKGLEYLKQHKKPSFYRRNTELIVAAIVLLCTGLGTVLWLYLEPPLKELSKPNEKKSIPYKDSLNVPSSKKK